MDLLKMVQEYTGQIMDDSLLTQKQQVKKIIQVLDLCRFIYCYKQSLKIINYKQHKINIVEDDGVRKGIYFCDLIYSVKYCFDRSLYKSIHLNAFRSKFNVEELWFVIVEERFITNDLMDSNEFIKQNNVAVLYDKIFHFNFSCSTVKCIK